MVGKVLRLIFRLFNLFALGVYLAVTRLLTFLLGLWTIYYFGLSSPRTASFISKELSDLVPGSFEIRWIQPELYPLTINVWGVTITPPQGPPVIKAGHVRTTLAILPILKHLLGYSRDVVLRFKHTQVTDAFLRFAFNAQGHFTFTDPFAVQSRGHPPSRPPDHRFILDFPRIELAGTRVLFHVGAWDLKIEGMSSTASFSIDVLRPETSMEIHVRENLAEGGSSVLHRCPLGPRVCHIPFTVFMLEEFSLTGVKHLAFNNLRIKAPGSTLETTLKMDLVEGGVNYKTSGRLKVSDPGYLEALTMRQARGPFTMEFDAKGSLSDPRFRAIIDVQPMDLAFVGRDLKLRASVQGQRSVQGEYILQLKKMKIDNYDGSMRVELSDAQITPLRIPWLQKGSLRFLGYRIPDEIPLPPLLALPRSWRGKVEWHEESPGVTSFLVELASTVKRPGLFQKGPLRASTRGRLDWKELRLYLERLKVENGTTKAETSLKLELPSLLVRGRGWATWDLTGLFTTLGLPFSALAVGRELKIRGTLKKPRIMGQIELKKASAWNVRGLTMVGLCDLMLDGLSCKRLTLRSSKSFLTGEGLRLSQWKRLQLGELRGVVDLGLLLRDAKGRVQMGIGELDIDLMRPSFLSGWASVGSRGLEVSGVRLDNFRARFRARKGLVHTAFLLHSGSGVVRFEGRVLIGSWRGRGKLLVRGLDISTLGARGLEGVFDGDLRIAHNRRGWSAEGRVKGRDVALGSVHLGDVELGLSGEGGSQIMLEGRLAGGAIQIQQGTKLFLKGIRPRIADFMIGLRDLDLSTVVDLGTLGRDFRPLITGNIEGSYDFSRGEFKGTLQVPDKGLILNLGGMEGGITSRGFRVLFSPSKVVLPKLTLLDKGHTLELAGALDLTALSGNLSVQGEIGLHLLRLFVPQVLQSTGFLRLGVRLMWDRNNLTGQGRIDTQDALITFEGLPEPIRILSGGRLLFTTFNGKLFLNIEEATRLRARMGEGSFSIWGKALLGRHGMEFSSIHMDGVNLKVESKGEVWLRMNPQLDFTKKGEVKVLSGTVRITQGAFVKDYSKLLGLSSESREVDISDILGYLKDTSLNVRIVANNFKVKNRFPFGETDIKVKANVSLKGTLRAPQVYDRVEVVPGSTVYYKLVARKFTVKKGSILFFGDPYHPSVNILAETTVQYHSKRPQVSVVQTGFIAQTLQESAGTMRDTILVRLQITGTYPDLGILLSSTARDLDQMDLEYLLLTGMTKEELGTGRGNINLGMLTQGLSGLLTKLLMAPVVDIASIGVEPTGGVTADVNLNFGRNLSVTTSVEQGTTFSRYSAGFRIRLLQNLTLEGLVRSVQMSPDPTEIGRRYETKLHLRIPLE